MSAMNVFELLKSRGLVLATAESCTGGMIAAAITDIAGSSEVFDRGFVTYSNAAKAEMLGVSKKLIVKHGAVSEQVARAMAEGALMRSSADVSVAVTGVAGPTGGTVEKPVGLVHFACGVRGGMTMHDTQIFKDDGRAAIRVLTRDHAFGLILSALAT